MEMEGDEIIGADTEGIDSDDDRRDASIPFLWTRKSTNLLLVEFTRLCPKVGVSFKNMTNMYVEIARKLKDDLRSNLTPAQVANKMKSLRRKYIKSLETGRRCPEFGPALQTAMKIMDQYMVKNPRPPRSSAKKINSQQIHNESAYAVEIVNDAVYHDEEGEVMDMDQFLKKKGTPGMSAADRLQDPLVEEVILHNPKSREAEAEKLQLLGKKIENQEKSLEEKLRKNDLIGERNKLIATLLTKKTRNDVVENIRKDRNVHHKEMKELWAERLELERMKLEERKRKNNLLQERNALMTALLEQMKTKIGGNSGQAGQMASYDVKTGKFTPKIVCVKSCKIIPNDSVKTSKTVPNDTVETKEVIPSDNVGTSKTVPTDSVEPSQITVDEIHDAD